MVLNTIKFISALSIATMFRSVYQPRELLMLPVTGTTKVSGTVASWEEAFLELPTVKEDGTEL